MSVFYQDPAVQLLNGDVMAMLQTLPDDYVQMVVTSPPYWGLRDYGVTGQLGLEKTPADYLAKMVAVFREVRRALKKNGTLWLNMGDCYNAGTSKTRQPSTLEGSHGYWVNPHIKLRVKVDGIKTKDMLGMPWRLAFALQNDGWYLRSDIIWNKTNPMPESVTDRPTKAHEYVFLLTKSPRYYYDAEAIKEPASCAEEAPFDPGTNGLSGADRKTGKSTRCFARPAGWSEEEGGHTRLDGRYQRNLGKKGQATNAGEVRAGVGDRMGRGAGWRNDPNNYVLLRNKRSVWTVGTEPFPGAHFATFPTKLIEPCILAGAPEGGLVLDPFAGAGTTLLVAKRLNRRGLGIELNPDYCALSMMRLSAEPARLL